MSKPQAADTVAPAEHWFSNGQPGNRYEGEFRDGKRKGHGVFYTLANGARYEGEFRDGILARGRLVFDRSLRDFPRSIRLYSSRAVIGMAMSKPQPNKPKHEEGTWRSPLPTEDEAPHRLRMSTQALPKRDRFEVFRENFSQYLCRAEVRNRSEGIFDGRIELLKAGSIGILRIAACPSTYARTRRHVSDSDDALTLFVGINNGLALEQAGISQQFRHGNGFLYHGAIPGAAEATAPIGLWGIKVAAGRITSRLAPGCSLKPMSIPAKLPAMKLIRQYLNAYATVASNPDGDVREAFGTHLTDLLMLIVGPDRDSLELIKGRGLKAARTGAVLKSIGRDFASPDLSAERIGLSLGITARQVHRLIEETTKTFYEHVLERRLIESHRLLTDPNCGTLNMAEIARRAGFVDRSYFHRVFRIRFGETPTDVRAASARENTGRFVQASPKRRRHKLEAAKGREAEISAAWFPPQKLAAAKTRAIFGEESLCD